METVDYIILGDYVLTMNGKMDVIRDGAVVVKGPDIIDAGDAESILKRYSTEKILGGKGRAILPGLINTHTHAAMVYFRGLADDMPLKGWLENYVWPAENKWLSPDFVFDAVELACLEMLKGGITTYSDMYFYGGSTALATRNMGMRAVIGAGVVDFPTPSGKNAEEYLMNAERFIGDWKDDGLITPCVAAHSAYACGPGTLKKIAETTDRLQTPRHIHLSETEWEVSEIMSKYGKRPVEHLSDTGFLGGNVLAAHCVHVDDGEIEMLSKNGVGVSHCIESNLKLASGFAPVHRMRKAGVKVGLGTDGAASNNDLNILSEMATAAKVHKAVAGDPTALDSRAVLQMATKWGAEALGLGNKIGSIEKGKRADIITLNLRKPHLMPMYDICSHMVYASMASDVEDVMIDGRVIVSNRVLVTGDEEEILNKASEWGKRILDHL